jgi:DNA-binding response OmpR family regulator
VTGRARLIKVTLDEPAGPPDGLGAVLRRPARIVFACGKGGGIADELTQILVSAGHQVETCEDSEDLLARVAQQPPDLVILDLAWPGSGGLAMCGHLVDGALRVDVSARQVSLGSAAIALTVREFDLLAYLMRHPRLALSREQLLAGVWNWTFGDTSTVTVHVRRLRAKLEGDHREPRRIVTVRGVGYRYEPGGHLGRAWSLASFDNEQGGGTRAGSDGLWPESGGA